jgi:hypothetical protein
MNAKRGKNGVSSKALKIERKNKMLCLLEQLISLSVQHPSK